MGTTERARGVKPEELLAGMGMNSGGLGRGLMMEGDRRKALLWFDLLCIVKIRSELV